MDADMLARARAVVARIGDTAATARDFGAVFTMEGPSALALIRLAEAVGRLAELPDWYLREIGPTDEVAECTACEASVELGTDLSPGIRHATDCPAMAITAVIVELAALDGGSTACASCGGFVLSARFPATTCVMCGREFGRGGGERSAQEATR